MIDTFSKDGKEGFTFEEALEKKSKVDEAHGVGFPDSKWKESVIEPDPTKEKGFRVVIETYSEY